MIYQRPYWVRIWPERSTGKQWPSKIQFDHRPAKDDVGTAFVAYNIKIIPK